MIEYRNLCFQRTAERIERSIYHILFLALIFSPMVVMIFDIV